MKKKLSIFGMAALLLLSGCGNTEETEKASEKTKADSEKTETGVLSTKFPDVEVSNKVLKQRGEKIKNEPFFNMEDFYYFDILGLSLNDPEKNIFETFGEPDISFERIDQDFGPVKSYQYYLPGQKNHFSTAEYYELFVIVQDLENDAEETIVDMWVNVTLDTKEIPNFQLPSEFKKNFVGVAFANRSLMDYNLYTVNFLGDNQILEVKTYGDSFKIEAKFLTQSELDYTLQEIDNGDFLVMTLDEVEQKIEDDNEKVEKSFNEK